MTAALLALMIALSTAAAPAVRSPVATSTASAVAASLPAGPLSNDNLAALLVRRAEDESDPSVAMRARQLLDASTKRAEAGTCLLMARACLASRPQDFACARQQLEASRAAGADPVEVDQRLGFLVAALGEDELARTLLERSTRPSTAGGAFDADASVALARLALARFEGNVAKAILRGSLLAHPRHAASLALLGRALSDQQPPQLDEALVALDGAIGVDPADLSARLLRARLLARATPGSEKAARDLAVHAALVRADEIARRPVGNDQARLERAEIFTRLATLEPLCVTWVLERARSIEAVGRRTEALGLLRSVEPNLHEASQHAEAARLALAWGEPSLGLELARRALAGDSQAGDSRTTAVAREVAGGCLLRLGSAEQALPYLELAAAALPHRASLRTLLAEACVASGKRDRAILELGAAVQIDPTDARALASLGGLLRDAGKRDEALAFLDEAVRVDPREPAAHANRGLLLHDLGRDAEAIAELRASAQLAPADRMARYNLGVLLVLVGRPAEAIPELQAALGPGSAPSAIPPDARQWLQRAQSALSAGGATALTK